jgi:hypothetical protein
MERVETLCNLLAQKIQNKASINELLSTVKMMESELHHLKNITPPNSNEALAASVHIAKQHVPANDEATLSNAAMPEEKIVQVLQIDEADVEAELEEIKKNVEVRSNLSYQNRPPVHFDGVDEIPTLANRQSIFDNAATKDGIKELNDILPTNNSKSLNDILNNATKEINHALHNAPAKELNEMLASKNTVSINDVQSKTESKTIGKDELEVLKEMVIPSASIHPKEELNNTAEAKELNEILPTNNAASLNDLHNKPVNAVSDLFEDTPIKDLKKAIGVNERFLYLNELFRGDEAMYERSIKTINAFSIYPEAEFWIRRELKLKLGWDDKYNTVKQFDQLVRRRFS